MQNVKIKNWSCKSYEGEIKPIKHFEGIYQSTIEPQTHVDNPRMSKAERLSLEWCMIADSSYKPRYASIILNRYEN
jgi:hypothetical protein